MAAESSGSVKFCDHIRSARWRENTQICLWDLVGHLVLESSCFPLCSLIFFPLWFVVWVCSVPKEALLLGCWCCWEVWEYLRGGHSWRKQTAGALPWRACRRWESLSAFTSVFPFLLFPSLPLLPLHLSYSEVSGSVPSTLCILLQVLSLTMFVFGFCYCQRERWNVISLLWGFFFSFCAVEEISFMALVNC